MTTGEPPLGAGPSDHAAAMLRMAAGTVPVVGSAFNELITLVIPGVRQARVETYLRFLNDKLTNLSQEQLGIKLASEMSIDLVEEGAFQAIRALSDERRDQITEAVVFGLNGEQKEVLEAKRVLQLLKELDDAQVIILSSKLIKYRDDSEFRDRHSDILSPIHTHLQSTREEIDRNILQNLNETKLVSLGLIKPRFRKFKKGEFPEFDEKTGMVKSAGTDITPLGRLFLRRLGLANENDF